MSDPPAPPGPLSTPPGSFIIGAASRARPGSLDPPPDAERRYPHGGPLVLSFARGRPWCVRVADDLHLAQVGGPSSLFARLVVSQLVTGEGCGDDGWYWVYGGGDPRVRA